MLHLILSLSLSLSLFVYVGHKCSYSLQEFVDSLKLEAHIQQDAEEFQKLFIGLLEGALTVDTCGSDVISDLYRGMGAMYTECLKCHGKSIQKQPFIDLVSYVNKICPLHFI